MRRLTTSESMFIALLLLSAISVVPTIISIEDKHPLLAKALSFLLFGILGFIFWILLTKNPRIEVRTP